MRSETPRWIEWMCDHPMLFMVGSIVLLVVLGAGNWVFHSHMEARAFNRVTGKSVSTWDAMFIELRVQEGSQE